MEQKAKVHMANEMKQNIKIQEAIQNLHWNTKLRKTFRQAETKTIVNIFFDLSL